jgi:hypothetical protein
MSPSLFLARIALPARPAASPVPILNRAIERPGVWLWLAKTPKLSLAKTPKRPGSSCRFGRDLTQAAGRRIVGDLRNGPIIDSTHGSDAGSRSRTDLRHLAGRDTHLEKGSTNSGSASLVAMMQPTDLRERHHLTELRPLHFPAARRVLAEAQVRPTLVVVADVLL